MKDRLTEGTRETERGGERCGDERDGDKRRKRWRETERDGER